MKKMVREDSGQPSKFLKNLLFFFDVLLALMIVFFSRFIAASDNSFAKLALLYGLFMLGITVLLKAYQKW
jgi:hypothetical protein